MLIGKLTASSGTLGPKQIETSNLVHQMLYDLIHRVFTGGRKQFGKQLFGGKACHRKDFKYGLHNKMFLSKDYVILGV
jgi:hypothetical protein